mmetsp:Transcript_19288/g.50602  ORF Transcript_19288/g.50602 Transcript_19288/m.50602 type:complete len:296 (-) Transcript_19288:356-1243(-)
MTSLARITLAALLGGAATGYHTSVPFSGRSRSLAVASTSAGADGADDLGAQSMNRRRALGGFSSAGAAVAGAFWVPRTAPASAFDLPIPSIDFEAVGKGANVVGGVIEKNLFEPLPDKSTQLAKAAAAAKAAADGEVAYDKFIQMLFAGDVARVQFYGQFGDAGAVVSTVAGQKLFVATPSEAANSSISPLQTVAKVRDAGVPYSFESFDLSGYKKNGVNYMNPRAVTAAERNEAEAKENAEFAEKRRAEKREKPDFVPALDELEAPKGPAETQQMADREGFTGPGRAKVGDVQF